MGSSQIYEKVKAEFDVEKENEIIEKKINKNLYYL